MCRVRRAAKVFRCFTATAYLVGTFTALPKLFVTSGQEVARVVFHQFLIWQGGITSLFFDNNDSFGPTHSTPYMPMAPLLL